MRGLALWLAVFVLLAFESPLLYQAHVAHYAPDVVLIAAIYLGLTSSFESGLFICFVLGFLKDGFALGSPVGLYTEITVLVFLVSFRLSRRLAVRGPVSVVFLTAFFSLGASFLELLLCLTFDRTFGQGASGPGLILSMMLPQALISAPFGPVVFWLLERLDTWTTHKNDSLYF